MTMLMQNERRFEWERDQKRSVDRLKEAFQTAPVLARFDFECDAVVETDASDYVSAGVLSQYNDQRILHAVTFFSKTHTSAECNYEIYDNELPAVVRAFERWMTELQSVINPVQVLIDHKNLRYIMITKLLNGRQTR